MDPTGWDTEPSEDLTVLEAPFHHPTAQVLVLRGAASFSDNEQLEAAFTRAAASHHPLIVDLAGLDFGDDTLLGLLLNARHTNKVILVGPLCPSFLHRLHRTGTDHIFDIRPTLTDALALLPH